MPPGAGAAMSTKSGDISLGIISVPFKIEALALTMYVNVWNGRYFYYLSYLCNTSCVKGEETLWWWWWCGGRGETRRRGTRHASFMRALRASCKKTTFVADVSFSASSSPPSVRAATTTKNTKHKTSDINFADHDERSAWRRTASRPHPRSEKGCPGCHS